MPTVAARLRIRNAADTADLVTFGMAEMSAWPEGDGTAVNVVTGALRSGSYVVKIVDNLALTAVLNDGDGRGQLKSRRALVEVQTDGGAWVQRIGGYVTRVSIRDGYDAEIEVGESLRVPGTALVPNASLAATVNRGALVGGPAIAAWGPVLSLGGWRGTVTAVSGRNVTVQITQSYAAPDFARNTTFATIGADVVKSETLMAPYTSTALADVDTTARTARATLLTARITRVSDSQISVGTPFCVPRGLITTLPLPAYSPVFRILTAGSYSVVVQVRTGDALPSVSDAVTVAIVTRDLSDDSPAYLDGHPLDIVSSFYTSIGVRLNLPSFAAVKDAVGSQLRYAYRVTAPFPLQEWVEKTVSGPLGVAFLPDANGDIAAVYMRPPLSSLPTATITLDDVSAVESVYEDTEEGSVALLVWEQDRYVKIATPTADDPVDAILANRSRQEFAIDTGNVYATRTISYVFDGQYYTAGQFDQASPEVVSSTQRNALASRYSRGAPETELRLRRDSATVAALQVGAFVLNTLPSLPSGVARLATQSGVSRIQQVTQITEGIGERSVTLEDVGVVGGTVATVPTLSLVASGSIYTVTITNAAALAAASIGVRLEVAQTMGAAPAAAEWTPLRSLASNALTTVSGTVTTAPITVWIRARGERDAFLPSAWSTSASVAISGLAGVTSLAAAAITGDGSQLSITWARSATDGAVFDVFVRLAASPQGTGIFAAEVPAGALSVVASGLTVSTLYTVDVRARIVATGQASAYATTTQTTNGTTATLASPSGLAAFTEGYGIVGVSGTVSGSPTPSADIDMATETTPGSGVFGSFVNLGEFAANSAGFFSQTFYETTDARLRQFRVRAVRAGATASSYIVATPNVLPPNDGNQV